MRFRKGIITLIIKEEGEKCQTKGGEKRKTSTISKK